MTPLVMQGILLVLLGGLFGWLLGRMPDRWVYIVAAVAIVLAVIVVGGAI